MSESLKPCPFCGGDAVSGDYQGQAWVDCLTCPGHVSMRGAEADAIAAWNTRASGWIPVNERLPSDQQKVLFCNKAKYPEVFKGVFLLTEDAVFAPAFLDDHGTSWCVDNDGAVDAWMPLPELPKI